MIKDIENFEEVLRKSLAREYETEYNPDEVINKTDEMYDLAATEIEDEDYIDFHKHMQPITFELKFDPINMDLVWFKNGKEIAREDYTEEEIIGQLEAGGYFDIILKYEDCDDDDDEIDND